MPPEESHHRPQPGRQPYPRRRIPVDGVSSPPMARPRSMARTPDGRAPGFQRPATVRAVPNPEQPQAPSLPSTSIPVQFDTVEQPAVVPQPPSHQPSVAEPAVEVPQEDGLAPPIEVTEPEIVSEISEPTAEAAAPTPKPEKQRFAPPKPKRDHRRARRIAAVAAVIVVAVGLIAFALQWQAAHSNIDAVFKEALQNSLATKQVQADVVAGTAKSQVHYDFSTPNDPTISNQATFQSYGAAFAVAAFGSTKNTYVSYTDVPSTVAPTVASSIKNAWVGIRNNGVLPAGVPAELVRDSDPRYQAFGPVVFGNYSAKASKQIVEYALAHTAYDYIGQKPTYEMVGDVKTTVYTVQPNVAALKVMNQIAATSSGLSPDDIQLAVDGLDQLKGADMKLYISNADHRVIRVETVKNRQVHTTTFSKFNTATIAAEPPTKLQWSTFATYQFQLAAQVASHQPAAQLDAIRKAQLNQIHGYLATYFKQVGSYPSLANLNDQAWVTANLVGFDASLLRDPLATSLTVLAAPKAATLAYQPVPDGGKGVCNNTPDSLCAHYKLSAVLSNNQQYSIQDP